MALFGIRFDLRNPAFAGTAMADRYTAALDMAAWADRIGFAIVTLSEHHGSSDGYLPSPLPMAAAIAARTEHIGIYVAAMVAAFHDPLRLAEDAAVVDLLGAWSAEPRRRQRVRRRGVRHVRRTDGRARCPYHRDDRRAAASMDGCAL